MENKIKRRFAIGAQCSSDGVHFRVWAPSRKRVEVVLEKGPGAPASIELSAQEQGYYSGYVAGANDGTWYRYRLDGEEGLYPDPASRFQPEGPHGPSCVVDPLPFAWTDSAWKGASLPGQVIYEMHIGTFTPQGTWQAAMEQLPELARAGVTLLEVMPVAEFPGNFGWGYDGVNLYAPTRLYGKPDDFRRFVDTAHAVGLGVILDVVYNHFGPDGNYIRQFSDLYFTDKYANEWGEAIRYEGPEAHGVREFFVENGAYWVEEFHLDGLRLDATQQIFDASKEHVLAALTRRVRKAAHGRSTIIVAENEQQHTVLARPLGQGGYGIDALWNDDFHHAATVALTGHNEAYYTDYKGTSQELLSAIKWGYLYQGQRYKWQKQRRGMPAFDLKPEAFVTFLENHDQVANSGLGRRAWQLTSPGRYRAMTALMLLTPATPMLFQGQEFASSKPFLYFADHNEELAKLVRKGRVEFLQQFPSLKTPEMERYLDDPSKADTFFRCKLDFSERVSHAESYSFHCDLLRLRRSESVLRSQARGSFDGATLSSHALVIRFFATSAEGHASPAEDLLLVLNLGCDLALDPAPEPLLAPPWQHQWHTLWSSEDPRYGGAGTPPLDTENNWLIPGEAAVLLKAVQKEKESE